MKKTVCIILVVFILFFFFSSVTVQAEKTTEKPTQNLSLDELYESQLEESGAKDLIYELEPETRKTLDDLNVSSPSWKELNSLSFSEIMMKILEISGKESLTPVSVISKILAVILLCALMQTLKTTFSSGPLGGVLGAVSTICICGLLVVPITQIIEKSADVISTSAGFIMALVPVMVGVMLTAGQAVAGASYYSVMMAAGTVVSQISSKVLVPLLNVFLGISVIGSISPKINLKGVCELISKVVKWVLTFTMSIFVTLLTMQNVLNSSADSTSVKAAKFAINSFVPMVGSALSEAFQTVQGSLKMLKSGVGVFAILGTGAIYLPSIIECLMWLLTINICAAAGDVFDLKEPCSLLRSTSKVISTLLAIILSCMVIFIISITIVLTIGGG